MKKITIRNLVYSSLALALGSSYLYVQSKTDSLTNEPLVASDQQAHISTEGLADNQTESVLPSTKSESTTLVD